MIKLNSVFLCTIAFVLSGCLPLSVYYKEGAQVSRIDSDQVQCDVFALKQVPQDIRRRYIPPVYQTRKHCNSLGHCSVRRILLAPGKWERFDANIGLREKVSAQYMIARGYDRVQLRACSPAVIEATPITATQVQPPLTSQSCAIRIKGDKYQIVTP